MVVDRLRYELQLMGKRVILTRSWSCSVSRSSPCYYIT